jgi:DNA-binding XRE family transcriptional regulator
MFPIRNADSSAKGAFMSRSNSKPDTPEPELPGVDDARHFGELVRAQRKAQGLRQEDVASATGVGRRYVVDMENGKPTLRIGPALMIARFLGIIPVVNQSTRIAPRSDLPDMISGDDADDLPLLED